MVVLLDCRPHPMHPCHCPRYSIQAEGKQAELDISIETWYLDDLVQGGEWKQAIRAEEV